METKANNEKMRSLQISLGRDWGMAVNRGIRVEYAYYGDQIEFAAWQMDQALFGIVWCLRTDHPVWVLGAVYANASRRKELWQHLSEALTVNMPCCLVGDYNQTLSA